MSDFLLSILLGVVEGLTEFLPIKSDRRLTQTPPYKALRFALLLLACADVRLSLVDLARSGGRAHGVSAGQFDGSSAHRRSAAQTRSARQFLEDVHDRHSTRRDPGVAGLFLGTHHEVAAHVSGRRARRPHDPDASA